MLHNGFVQIITTLLRILLDFFFLVLDILQRALYEYGVWISNHYQVWV